MSLKRRDFLKLTGLSMAWGASTTAALGEVARGEGRLFEATPLYIAPQRDAPQVGLLPADSVHPILGRAQGGWFRLAGGYVPERSLQPLLPIHQDPLPALPAWLEVCAPYLAVRRWADAAAPLRVRLGHGAVVWAESRFEEWLELSDEAGHLGWAQMKHLQAPRPPQPRVTHFRLQNGLLSAWAGEKRLGQTGVRAPHRLPQAGTYALGARRWGFQQDDWRAVPYGRGTECGLLLHGVYWHNNFPSHQAAPRLELPLGMAKWVFFADDTARLILG